jgi:hypothetical protein
LLSKGAVGEREVEREFPRTLKAGRKKIHRPVALDEKSWSVGNISTGRVLNSKPLRDVWGTAIPHFARKGPRDCA